MKISHVYEDYDVYKALYGRNFEVKSVEVQKCAEMLYHYKKSIKKDFDLHIVEFFAGKSEHKEFWKYTNPQHRIISYLSVDKCKNSNPDVITGDVRTIKLPTKTNVTLSHYFSPHFIKDDRGVHTREALTQAFKNIYSQLKQEKHAVSLWHICNADELLPIPLQRVYYASGKEYEVKVDYDNPLFTKYGGIPYKKEVFIRGIERSWFDRLTQTTYEVLSNLHFYLNSKRVDSLEIEQPFTYRLWSENEVIDSALDAGWKNLMTFNSTYSNEDYGLAVSLLPNQYTYDDIPGDSNRHSVTDLLLHL